LISSPVGPKDGSGSHAWDRSSRGEDRIRNERRGMQTNKKVYV
jgi:hypothetical protein